MDKRKRGSTQMDMHSIKMELKSIRKDIEDIGRPHMTWKEKKAMENRKVVSLGGKAPKKQGLPLSVARVMMKKQKERDQKTLQESMILGQVGGNRGNRSKRTSDSRKPEDRVLMSTAGRFRNGVLDVKDLLKSSRDRGSSGRNGLGGGSFNDGLGGGSGGRGSGKGGKKGGKKKGGKKADVLRWLAGNASHNLDIMAQYWQLAAHPDDPNSGDYGYSKENMSSFGSNDGLSVYKSIEDAADRNVNVRLLQHSGVSPDYTREPSDLASGRPNVKNVTLLIKDWFESGVLHAKVWISDSRHVYIGSANNDWKSLTQVKEVGIYLVDCPKIVKKVEVFYNNLWKLGYLNHSDFTRKIWDEQWQISRTVPCWSHFIPHKKRCKSPLPRYVDVHHTAGYPMITDPSHFHEPIQTPGSNYSTNSKPPLNYLSFAPPELSFKKYQADEQAWVETIKSVTDGETVRISTMDWLGQSEYASQTVYWSTLSTAISEVIFSKHAKVKILVAYWAYFIDYTDVYLKSLLYSNNLCSSSPYNKCSGKIEIKYYMVPGFNSTGPAIINGTSTGNKYPDFTRVNHGKYAVSDKRAHIGTSNLMWDYF